MLVSVSIHCALFLVHLTTPLLKERHSLFCLYDGTGKGNYNLYPEAALSSPLYLNDTHRLTDLVKSRFLNFLCTYLARVARWRRLKIFIPHHHHHHLNGRTFTAGWKPFPEPPILCVTVNS